MPTYLGMILAYDLKRLYLNITCVTWKGKFEMWFKILGLNRVSPNGFHYPALGCYTDPEPNPLVAIRGYHLCRKEHLLKWLLWTANSTYSPEVFCIFEVAFDGLLSWNDGSSSSCFESVALKKFYTKVDFDLLS